jgi:hypothetical protein
MEGLLLTNRSQCRTVDFDPKESVEGVGSAAGDGRKKNAQNERQQVYCREGR